MIRIFIADDHAIVREGLKQILQEEEGLTVAGEATDGAEALKLLQEEIWDIAILDISMPEMDGFNVLREIKKVKPAMPVIILTMHDEHLLGARCLKAGANGFLTKESASNQLATAIRMALEGGKYISPAISEKIIGEMGSSRNQDRPPHEKLSNREFTILVKIASGMTVSEIGEELGISTRTVSTYRRRLLRKMEMKHNAELTHYALKKGLSF